VQLRALLMNQNSHVRLGLIPHRPDGVAFQFFITRPKVRGDGGQMRILDERFERQQDTSLVCRFARSSLIEFFGKDDRFGEVFHGTT
jgi:hypothetical protein